MRNEEVSYSAASRPRILPWPLTLTLPWPVPQCWTHERLIGVSQSRGGTTTVCFFSFMSALYWRPFTQYSAVLWPRSMACSMIKHVSGCMSIQPTPNV